MAAGAWWPEHRDRGSLVEPVFTTPAGELVLRQSVTKVLQKVAKAAGIDPAGEPTGEHPPPARASLLASTPAYGPRVADALTRNGLPSE